MLTALDEPQLSIFQDRLPRRPYCSDNLEYGVRVRSLKTALRKPYIQVNPPDLRFWMVFDVDREGGGLAWEDADLPPPAWAAINRENGHAHLAYGLSAPVLVAEAARREPIRFLQGIEGAYRDKLQSDRGYSGLITKNPKHPLWKVLYGPKKLWELNELAEYGDVTKYIPRYAKKPEEIGLGRNCIVFEYLRQWAYQNIKKAKERGNFIYWQSDCNIRAMGRNADFAHPLDQREIWHIAKSVARWTWNKFDIAKSDRKFQQLQTYRGRLGGKAKGLANEEAHATARLMAIQGIPAAQIAEALGVSCEAVLLWIGD